MTNDNTASVNDPLQHEIDDVVYAAVRVELLLSVMSDISVMGVEASPRLQTMLSLCHDMAKALVPQIDSLPRVRE